MLGKDAAAFLCRNSGALVDAEDPGLLGEAVRVVVPCGGRVDVLHLLKAVENGARTVVVVACHIDNCLSLSGTDEAELRVARANALLVESGSAARCAICRAAANAPADLRKALSEVIHPVGARGPEAEEVTTA
jgi:coenzyme F420-reducing hydrogenase delta subunit